MHNSGSVSTSDFEVVPTSDLNTHQMAIGKAENVAVIKKNKIVNVPAEEIASFVSNIREAICKQVSKGQFKVWLKGEASGKLLGIGTSGESGIEVTIQCG